MSVMDSHRCPRARASNQEADVSNEITGLTNEFNGDESGCLHYVVFDFSFPHSYTLPTTRVPIEEASRMSWCRGIPADDERNVAGTLWKRI
jgi:hypothetical protein